MRSDADSDSLNLMTVKEEQFEKLVNYIARDLPTSLECPNKAENSLPRNLELRPSKAINDVRIISVKCCFRHRNVYLYTAAGYAYISHVLVAKNIRCWRKLWCAQLTKCCSRHSL